LPPALISLDATAFEKSTDNILMLVVLLTVAVEITATVVAFMGF
jgi:hypothetical protein